MKKSLFFLFLLNCGVCFAQQSKPKVSGKIQALTFTATAEDPPSIDSLFIADKIALSEANEETRIITWFGQLPEFPGGIPKLREFLQNNLHYPEVAKKLKIEGVVYIHFIITIDGTIDEIKVKRGIGYGCDEEVIRIIKLMPKWKPASSGGRNISSPYSLPISFVLSGKKK
ncbi:energy transducer TonB [Cytophagaceae bacterium DM2B3-1]|uniref:Energy transducer TonB n=1 Tax=Xanthocytophaga flava TaxID=3048013 RepID=A0ABT7CN55_9BACT|nr:energy transducer TonB [Xanthocytophaga flavus]MDJ1469940.1 energy transducer TonB [Xanthocytophaga flavus]MDJ1494450.1 energy transducer TonB [Xanthocytophaga flavus]